MIVSQSKWTAALLALPLLLQQLLPNRNLTASISLFSGFSHRANMSDSFDDSWDFLGSDAAASAESATTQTSQGTLVLKRKAGRPLGSTGSTLVRKRCQAMMAHQLDHIPPSLVSTLSHTNSIELARRHREQKPAVLTSSNALLCASSKVWQMMKDIGCFAQQILYQAAYHSYCYQEDSARENQELNIIFSHQRHVMSNVAFRMTTNDSFRSLSHFKDRHELAASVALDSGCLFWGGFMNLMSQKIANGDFRPVAFIKGFRYDETPTRVRLDADQETLQSGNEIVAHAKVMQTELKLHIVVQDMASKKYVHFHGKVPTTLQIVNRTSAECIKRSIMNTLSTVPEFQRISSLFPFKLQLTTADRYSANLKAERSIFHDDISWTKCTLPCDIHIASQVNTLVSGIVNEDSSGIVSTHLSQAGGSVLNTLHDILRRIFEKDLVICFDAPPGGRMDVHRQAVFDVYLPFRKSTTSEFGTARSQRKIARARYILGSLLNGDIEEPEIIHFCMYGCCNNEAHTRSKFAKFVVEALLPSKAPRFARNRWTGQEASLCWNGLLCAHHHLHKRLLTEFTGVPVPTVSNYSDSNAIGWDILFEDAHDDVSHVSPQEVEPPASMPDDADQELMDLMNMLGGDKDESQTGTDHKSATDWVTLNKMFRTKSGRWAQSDPGPRLAVWAEVMSIVSNLMYAFLKLSGESFDEVEAAKTMNGQHRLYRILIAALGQDVSAALSALKQLFDRSSNALPCAAFNMKHRALSFKLISRAGCSLHCLLQVRREGYPYKLFKLLRTDRTPRFDASDSCLHDEFTKRFLQHFPDPTTEEALSVLETIARAATVDISAIEARHASIRRLATLKSLQTWVAKFRTVSADMCCRQISIAEAFMRADCEQTSNNNLNRNKRPAGKKPGKSGSGAGAYRAFLHIHHAGKQFSAASLKETLSVYKSLGPEQKEFYDNLGKNGYIAWRGGFKSFGEKIKVPKLEATAASVDVLPGETTSTGAIVAVCSPDRMPTPTNQSLMTFKARIFETDLDRIDKKFKQSRQEQRNLAKTASSSLSKSSRELMSQFPRLNDANFMPPVDIKADASISSKVVSMGWFPPCSNMAKVRFIFDVLHIYSELLLLHLHLRVCNQLTAKLEFSFFVQGLLCPVM